jgi:hypothetical protein
MVSIISTTTTTKKKKLDMVVGQKGQGKKQIQIPRMHKKRSVQIRSVILKSGSQSLEILETRSWNQ